MSSHVRSRPFRKTIVSAARQEAEKPAEIPSSSYSSQCLSWFGDRLLASGGGVHWRIVGVAAFLVVLALGWVVTGLTKHGKRPSERSPVAETQVSLLRLEEAPAPVPAVVELKKKEQELTPGAKAPAPVDFTWMIKGMEALRKAPAALAEAAAAAGPVPAKKAIFKRRSRLSDEELRRQLVLAPEVRAQLTPEVRTGLTGKQIVFFQPGVKFQDNDPFESTGTPAKATNSGPREKTHDSELFGGTYTVSSPSVFRMQAAPKDRIYTPEEIQVKYDVAGLPVRMGLDCQLSKEAADNLQALSRELRTVLSAATPAVARGVVGDNRPDPAVLRSELTRDKWLRVEAIPTLTQMLMAENKPLRLVLVEVLGKIKETQASTALAQRAIYDLSEEVREAAVLALADRPRDEYREVLLNGLRYPWAAVADHAAEALATLDDQEAIPRLVKLLQEPDPNTPHESAGKKELMVSELVRINHLSNCSLCHVPSKSQADLVRGRIPSPLQALPPAISTQYYESNEGIFVHADVTYLRQDFSVPQPVAKPGLWPAHQRYDYVVRIRPSTVKDSANTSPYEQRESVLFALRELTGQDAGVSSKSWQKYLDERKGKNPTP